MNKVGLYFTLKILSYNVIVLLNKHSSAAQMLRDVGAVDFLTQLSPNVDPGLQAVISGVLDQLFHLPDFFPSQTVAYSHGPHDAASTGVEI